MPFEPSAATPDPTQTPPTDNGSSDGKVSRVGKFIQTYHNFLSSFVIGVAGLLATSIWQYRQATIAERQAESEQQVARTQADNSWRIEKANILAKNFQVLTSPQKGKEGERYGVLLSLTRAKILDPELAIAYALDLGKESPEDMRSVLNNTENKDYWRLARAFEPTCKQRYGVSRNIALCHCDKLADRSTALAEVIADDIRTTPLSKTPASMLLLEDEHQAQGHATRLAWLFTPALINMYERRQWKDISRFEKTSRGAQLVAALVLASARNGEQRLVSAQEKDILDTFHHDHRKWLTDYIFENGCDNECKANLVDFMLTAYEESEGEYDMTMSKLLERPRDEVGRALSRLQSRLLWCQVDTPDLVRFRDLVLVPTLTELFQRGQVSSETFENLVGLIAVTNAPEESDALKKWKALIALIERSTPPGSPSTNKTYASMLAEARIKALDERASPRSGMKKMSFCPAVPPNKAGRLQLAKAGY